jgi:Anti-sigma-28 factor, FlgM
MPMEDATPMDEDREKVADMAEKIRRGEYRVEPVAVADAIVRQLRALAAARTEHVASGDRASAADALRLNAHTPRAGLASQ